MESTPIKVICPSPNPLEMCWTIHVHCPPQNTLSNCWWKIYREPQNKCYMDITAFLSMNNPIWHSHNNNNNNNSKCFIYKDGTNHVTYRWFSMGQRHVSSVSTLPPCSHVMCWVIPHVIFSMQILMSVSQMVQPCAQRHIRSVSTLKVVINAIV